MRSIIVALVLLALSTPMASAHCSKPHPDGKDRTTTARPLPKPE